MARSSTVSRVHQAVLDLAGREGPGALTMEGIAAEASAGKQTLYRTWPSVTAIVFDALAQENAAPSIADEATSIESVLRDAIAEISTEPRSTLLRVLAASIQTDEDVAQEFRERLLAPQLAQVERIVRLAGARDPSRATELLLAPIFYRWFMRLPPHSDGEVETLVREVMGRDRG